MYGHTTLSFQNSLRCFLSLLVGIRFLRSLFLNLNSNRTFLLRWTTASRSARIVSVVCCTLVVVCFYLKKANTYRRVLLICFSSFFLVQTYGADAICLAQYGRKVSPIDVFLDLNQFLYPKDCLIPRLASLLKEVKAVDLTLCSVS